MTGLIMIAVIIGIFALSTYAENHYGKEVRKAIKDLSEDKDVVNK